MLIGASVSLRQVCVLTLMLCGVCSAAEQKKAVFGSEFVIGKWTARAGSFGFAKDSDPDDRLEFSADGKLKLTLTCEGETSVRSATWSVEGQSLVISLRGPKGKQERLTYKATAVNEKQMELIDPETKATLALLRSK